MYMDKSTDRLLKLDTSYSRIELSWTLSLPPEETNRYKSELTEAFTD